MSAVLEHDAVFYHGPEELPDAVLPFVREGLRAGEPVLVAVRPPAMQQLRGQLGPDVATLDMADVGRNPGRIIAAVHRFADRHRDRAARFVGEPIWPGRTPEEIKEATRHEGLLNLAFADRPLRILCPYDADALDPAVLAHAECTHPHLLEAGERRASACYAGPAPPAACDEPLPDPPPGADALALEPGRLGALRRLVADHAARAGLAGRHREELVLAASEAAGNTLRHGGGRGIAHVWSVPGRLVCEVRDRGRIGDPLAGRRDPGPGVTGGRGLWLMHHLCDLVEIRSGDRGTTVRLHGVASPPWTSTSATSSA